MGSEIQTRVEDSKQAQQSHQQTWKDVVADLYKPMNVFQFKPELKAEAKGQLNLPELTIESAPRRTPPKEFIQVDKIPAQDLTPEQKKLGDKLTEALANRDTRIIDALIKANAEYPKNLGLAIEYANAHFDQDPKGMVIAYRYAERNLKPRSASDDDFEPTTPTKSESGYIAYNFATWEDRLNADGKRAGMRIPAKFGGGHIKTSAYMADSDDITQPIGLNAEDINGMNSFVARD